MNPAPLLVEDARRLVDLLVQLLDLSMGAIRPSSVEETERVWLPSIQYCGHPLKEMKYAQRIAGDAATANTLRWWLLPWWCALLRQIATKGCICDVAGAVPH